MLFAFGKPWLSRTAHLNHNMIQADSVTGSFLLLWGGSSASRSLSRGRQLAAGLLAGYALFVDYSSVIPLLALFVYRVLGQTGLGGHPPLSTAIVAGCLVTLGGLTLRVRRHQEVA